MNRAHTIPMIDGDEMDAFSAYTKRHVARSRGQRKAVKRRYNKRQRRVWRTETMMDYCQGGEQ